MKASGEILGWPHNRMVADAVRKTFENIPGNDDAGRRRTLVMLSGGIDSVALLANLLSETDHEIHAHHIELGNRENRQLAENDAVADVVDFCWRNYRDFSYSTSRSDFRISSRGYDLVVTMFHAALVAISSEGNFDFVATGHFDTREVRARYGQQMLSSCFLSESARPTWVRPLDALKQGRRIKADIYRSVPPPLAELCWSCRTPVPQAGGFRPCGACYACRNLEEARNPQLVEGENE